MAATGTFNNGTTQSLTQTATWSSDVPTVATVTNSGTRGRVTAILIGTTTIKATATVNSVTVTGVLPLAVVGVDLVAVAPHDVTTGNQLATPIVVAFGAAVTPATVTTQTVAGTCSGSLQLSADNFATCVRFATATVVMNTANTVATATPAAALQPHTTYRIRVLNTVKSAAGPTLGVDITQATGFATGGGETCATGLVISQVYGGGGNSGAPFSNDFIELHNAGTTPIGLGGLAVQFVSPAAANWAVQALPSVTLAAGGYFLIQETAGADKTKPLPAPDFAPTPVFAMGASSGKVALTANTTPLIGTCPFSTSVIDLVGFGIAATVVGGCFEGVAGTGAPDNPTAALRNGAGCADSNANSLDFTVAAPTPRNATLTPVNVCTCQ
jgi:hypothetical protein